MCITSAGNHIGRNVEKGEEREIEGSRLRVLWNTGHVSDVAADGIGGAVCEVTAEAGRRWLAK